jgi:hypothetical protein
MRIGLLVAGAIVTAMVIALAVMVRDPGPPSVAAQAGEASRPRDQAPAAPTTRAAESAADAAVVAGTDPGGAGERELMLNTLRESGTAAETWDAQATKLLTAFGAGSLEHTAVECYTAGCATTVTFASADAYRGRVVELVASPDYRAWTGGKRFSAPEAHTGTSVMVALVLYRPD